MSIKRYQLKNNLTVILEHLPGAVSASVGVFAKTGARDEVDGEYGISHFLEHMVFKGTPHRTGDQLDLDFGNIGAIHNAQTSDESTIYYGTVLPECAPKLTELLLDMMSPTLTQQEFDTEKKVILEEIAMYRDQPQHSFIDDSLQDYFAGHILGRSVIGSSESVSAITSEQMRQYHLRRYSSGNLTVVVSGNFNTLDVESVIANMGEKLSDFKADREYQKFSFPAKEKIYQRPNLNLSLLFLIGPAPATQDVGRYDFSIWSTIFGDHTGSRLYWELTAKGLAESVYFSPEDKDQIGRMLTLVSAPKENLDQCLTQITKIFKNPMDFTDDELERAKTKILSRVALSFEQTKGRMFALGESQLYRQEIFSVEETLNQIRRVDRQSISKVLSQYNLENFGHYRLLPAE